MNPFHLIAPGKYAGNEVLENALRFFSEIKIPVLSGKCAAGKSGYFSGTDEERTGDFNEALETKNADIFFLRGGYGAIKVLEKLQENILQKQRPFIYGYSDATVFHLKMAQYNLPSCHCPMALDLPRLTQAAKENLENIILKKTVDYTFSSAPENISGQVNAPVIGGNLAVICSMLGSKHMPDFKEKILFIEDVDEALYGIDRMLMGLKMNGVLSQLSGLVVGQFASVKDSDPAFGKDYKEIILEYVKDYGYPVCFDFPAGHIDNNFSFYMGVPTLISIGPSEVVFKQIYHGGAQ